MYRDRLLRRLVSTLDSAGIEYVVFKTLNRLGWVGVDVDVAVHRSQYWDCVEALRRGGFHSIDDLWKDYGTGFMLADNPIVVDLHTRLATLGMTYMSADPILRSRVVTSFRTYEGSSLELSIPSPVADAASRIAHSVMKEGLVTLDDVAETYGSVLESSKEVAHLLKTEGLILAARVFSRVASELFRSSSFDGISFDGHLSSALVERLCLASHNDVFVPPVVLPWLMYPLVAIQQLRRAGVPGGLTTPFVYVLGSKRSMAHLGRKALHHFKMGGH